MKHLKYLLIACLSLCMQFYSKAQTVVNPSMAAKSVEEGVDITGVEQKDNFLVMSFTVRQPTGSSLFIPKETYIVSSEGGQKMPIIKGEGIEIGREVKVKKKGKIEFKLYFPRPDKDVCKINYRDGIVDTKWNFFEIKIKEGNIPSKIKMVKGSFVRNGKKIRYIDHPKFTASSSSWVNVDRIELCDSATVLYFHVVNSNNIVVPSGSCIQNSAGGPLLFVRSADGVLLDKNATVEKYEIRYKLYFPPLDKEVKQINFKEMNTGGNWSIFELDISAD